MSARPRLANLPAGSMVFCDFDGTITERDTLQAVCHEFIPDVAARLLPAIGRREVSLRAGVSELIGNLPTAAAGKIMDFVCREPLRSGFECFARQLRDWGMPLVVLSGGMGFCVEARLHPWRHLIHGVHALDIDLNQAFMRVQIHHDSGKEAVPKRELMLAYGADYNIVIGDSISDNGMALQADQVFARDRLLSYMHNRNRAVEAFHDFGDILDIMQSEPERSQRGIPAAVIGNH